MDTATMAHTNVAEHASDASPLLLHQFDDVHQQSESSILGMWLFLATEVMFFGGLLTAFAVYRLLNPREIALASQNLNVPLGCVNTMVLLVSSLTMALAVRASQLGRRKDVVRMLLLTMIFGTMFLVVKGFEWRADYHENLIPWINFEVPHHQAEEVHELGLVPAKMELFFIMYFFMTGLHALHLIIGIVMLAIMAHLVHRNWFSGSGAVQIEVAGLYWHFIDIVWVFLYPLLYLISAH